MELRHLRYFLTLAEELSFNKAAEKLHISQPPLSRQIKELEDEIGARLFDRNNKRVVLTTAGKYFETEVKSIVQSLERIAVKTHKIHAHINGEFSIAYISSTFSDHIGGLVKFLSNKFPYVTFRLYEITTAKQILSLEQGTLDLGIVRGPVKSPGIKTRLWFRDSYSVVYNKKRIRLASENDLYTLRDETFIFFNKDYAPYYYDTLLQICSRYGFIPKVVHESNNVDSIIQLVKNGLGTSIVPTNVVNRYNTTELGFIELKSINFFSEVLLATPKDDTPVSKAALQFLMNSI